MTRRWPKVVEALREEVARHGLRAIVLRTGVPMGQIRSVVSGRDVRVSTAERICAALDLGCYIGPSDAALAPPVEKSRQTPVENVAPIRDRALAVLLTAITAHWRELGTLYAREEFEGQIYQAHPKLRARRSTLSDVVAWFGWRVLRRRQKGA